MRDILSQAFVSLILPDFRDAYQTNSLFRGLVTMQLVGTLERGKVWLHGRGGVARYTGRCTFLV